MEKFWNRLKTKDNILVIEGAKDSKKYFYKGRPIRRRIWRRWYTIYLTTTLSAVLAVLLLILFGVGGNGKLLREELGISAFADKVVAWLVGSDGHRTGTDSEETYRYDDDTSEKDPPVSKPGGDVSVSVSPNGLYDFDYSLVPEGHIPIIPMDLSLSQYGDTYINNDTGYLPNTAELIDKQLGERYEQMSSTKSPLVLIIHTHGTEAYSENGAISFPEDEQDHARTSDTDRNVVAVGRALADELIKNGIPTAHCTILHDSVQYKDSYARAEDTINRYLAEYPTIKLVIDVHRDSIVRSTGEVVRPVTEYDGQAAAQVMCVVGSSWAGDECPNWENNLSLALKLKRELNEEYESLCRPPYLKGNTYNQEIAPYSLLLEVGSQGNSLEEAVLSARLVGEKLSELVGEI